VWWLCTSRFQLACGAIKPASNFRKKNQESAEWISPILIVNNSRLSCTQKIVASYYSYIHTCIHSIGMHVAAYTWISNTLCLWSDYCEQYLSIYCCYFDGGMFPQCALPPRLLLCVHVYTYTRSWCVCCTIAYWSVGCVADLIWNGYQLLWLACW